MKLVKLFKSKDGKTAKFLQETDDSHIIETGYFDLEEHIVCISSQIGCLMGCIFCATTKSIKSKDHSKTFVRNLTSKEIVQQVKNVFYCLQKQNKLGSKRILFSYMGMGEPFLNYENVVNSIKILSKEFPNSRVTISTLGTKPALIKKLAHEKINTILKLHLSLHAPNDILRKKILPKAQKIQPTLEALKYFSSIKKVPVKVNYVLIKSINDLPECAEQLADLLKPYPFIVKLSILNLNDFNNLKPSNEEKFNMFEKILKSKGIKTCRFFPNGIDISASCGQLRRYYSDDKDTNFLKEK